MEHKGIVGFFSLTAKEWETVWYWYSIPSIVVTIIILMFICASGISGI
jgi:hypothetical protein